VVKIKFIIFSFVLLKNALTSPGFCYIVERARLPRSYGLLSLPGCDRSFALEQVGTLRQLFARFSENWIREMAEGIIKRVTDKGFGFIEDGSDKDMFFHSSAVEGCSFDELREGQKVSFNVGQGPKGPRADNVRVI